jgi:hypothetical protein
MLALRRRSMSLIGLRHLTAEASGAGFADFEWTIAN